MHPNRSLLPVLLLLLAVPAWGQDSLAVTGRLTVETNLPEGLVYVDGAFVGRAAAGPFEVAVGERAVLLVEPNREAWTPRQASAEVIVGEEPVTVALGVPWRYRIESLPFGAEVRVDEAGGPRVIGTTPLTLTVDERLDGRLFVEKPGYAPEPVGELVWEGAAASATVMLRPLSPDAAAAEPLGYRPEPSRRWWIDAAALGFAAAGAAVAVYTKFEADERYDAYLETGDPTLRPDIERYDTYSAVALGVSAVGLGTFAVRLALR